MIGARADQGNAPVWGPRGIGLVGEGKSRVDLVGMRFSC